MIESTLSESTAKHPAPDLARHTLVPSRVNNTIACPVQNKENKKQNEKHAQIVGFLLTQSPFLRKFQMRHLAPGGRGSDNFLFLSFFLFFFLFFGGEGARGGKDHMAFGGNRRRLLRGSQRDTRGHVFDS